jgi:hypothetical protein
MCRISSVFLEFDARAVLAVLEEISEKEDKHT